MSHTRMLLRILVISTAAIGIGYGGYDLYSRYVAFSETIARDKARAAEIETNRARTTVALEGAGVDSLRANRGFWYTSTDAYGGESVAYFNTDLWSQQENLTDEQLAELARIVSKSVVVGRESMRQVAEKDLPPQLQFHNALYSDMAPGQFQGAQLYLENVYEAGTATAEELWRLSYMYELQGDYKKRDAVNAAGCKLYKARCAGTIPVHIVGTVTDIVGKPVQGARVSVLSHPEHKGATTDLKGGYAIQLSVLPIEKLRLSAVKRNFSEGIASLIVPGPPPADTAHEDGSFTLRATSSTYEIPAGAIVDDSGKPYQGLVDVYIYEFTRDTVPQSLTTLDTFDRVMGYAGDLMQSYGMPYIQFFTPDGTELDVRSGKPMLLTYKIAAMRELRENVDDNPAGPLTDAQMQELLAASKGNRGFPITRDWLVERKLYTFPPFWVFDRKGGVWDNVGIRVLDGAGTIQTPFYTVK